MNPAGSRPAGPAPRLAPGMRVIDGTLLAGWPLPPAGAARGLAPGGTLMIAGSALMPGAAILAATAALRVGAGPVSVATARSVAPILAVALPESRVLGLRETPRGGLTRLPPGTAGWEFGTLLVGPGMPGDDATARLLQGARARHPRAPLVLSAGATQALGSDAVPWDRFVAGPVLALADDAELAALAGTTPAEVQAHPARVTQKAARHWRVAILHRGSPAQVAAPDGRTFVLADAPAGLSLPGAGAVLGGIAVGLLARGAGLEQAAAWSLALHAAAFAALVGRLGPVGGLAREVVDELPGALRRLDLAAGQHPA